MQVNQFSLFTEVDDICIRSRYEGQWEVITTHSIYVKELHFSPKYGLVKDSISHIFAFLWW